MYPPKIKVLDNRTDPNGYVVSDNKRSPSNFLLERHLFKIRREAMLVKIIRDSIAEQERKKNVAVEKT